MTFDQNEQVLADAVQAENDRVTNVTRGEFDQMRQELAEVKVRQLRASVFTNAPDHAANIRDIVKAFADNTFHNRSDVQERIRQAVDAYIDGCKRAKRL